MYKLFIFIISQIFVVDSVYAEVLYRTTSKTKAIEKKREFQSKYDDVKIDEASITLPIYLVTDASGKVSFTSLVYVKANSMRSDKQIVKKEMRKVKVFSVNGKTKQGITRLSFEDSRGSYRTIMQMQSLDKKQYLESDLEYGGVLRYGNHKLSVNGDLNSVATDSGRLDISLYWKDLSYNYYMNTYTVNIGNQIRVWGDLDELSELDILSNKKNNRVFFDVGENLRRPKTILYIEKNFINSSLSLFLSPSFKMRQSPLSIIAEDEFGAVNVSSGEVRGVNKTEALSSLIQNSKFRNMKNSDYEFGLRFSLQDYQLVLAQYVDPIATLLPSEKLKVGVLSGAVTQDSLDGGFEFHYETHRMIGASFSKQLDNSLVKFETTYKTGFSVLDKSLNIKVVDKFTSALGIEKYLERTAVSLRIQTNYYKFLLDEEIDIAKSQLSFLTDISKVFRERYELRLRNIYIASDQSFMYSPQISFSYSDNMSFNLSLYNFSGRDGSLFSIEDGRNVMEFSFKGLF